MPTRDPKSPATAAPWTAVLLAAAALMAGGAAPAGPAEAAADEAPTATVSVEAVVVEPPQLGPDTLCRLKVLLRNRGPRIASQLGFAVRIDGRELPVYRNQLFMFPVRPGSEPAELRLYNFWSTETGRPMPPDGELTVEVTLQEAQWMDIRDEEGVEVWEPLGAVPGLPSSASVSLPMKAPG